MRRRDFSGEKEWSGDMELMCWRMVAREAGWKIVGSLSWVIRRVLEGGRGGSELGGWRDRGRGGGGAAVRDGLRRGGGGDWWGGFVVR